MSLVLLAVAYNLPWLMSNGAGLTMDGFDLAEWASLHPDVVHSTPGLLTSLFLRIIPVIVIAIVATNTPPYPSNRRLWLSSAFITIIVAVMLFPPFEFLTSERGNMNYRQMFVISISCLVGGGVGLSGIFYRMRFYVMMVGGICGVLVSTFGLSQVFQLYADFYLPRQVAIGGILTILAFAMIVIVGVQHILSKRKRVAV